MRLHFSTLNYTGPAEAAPIVVANVASGASVTLRDFKVDGSLVTAMPAGATRLVGVLFRETGGLAAKLDVTQIMAGDPSYGILLSSGTNAVTDEVATCTVDQFYRSGINIHGDTLIANIHGNTVTGRGPLGVGDAAQNGIDAMNRALVNITGNTVSGLEYTPADWTACGICVFEADGVVSNNTVTGAQLALAFEPYEPAPSGVWHVSFTDNNVDNSGHASPTYNGIGIDPSDICTKAVVTVSRNDVVGTNGLGSALYFGADEPSSGGGGPAIATVSDNRFAHFAKGIDVKDGSLGASSTATGNDISNDTTGIAIDGASVYGPGDASHLLANHNSITGNGMGAENAGGKSLDARDNWWGTSAGPQVGRPNGVTGLVNYTPWTTAGGAATYDNSAGTTVSAGASATVSVPAGNGGVMGPSLVVTVISAPSSLSGGYSPSTVFLEAGPTGTDFGADRSKWPTITLNITASAARYQPYYFNGATWVPYAATDYCDMNGSYGAVTVISGKMKFKVRHFTDLGGGGGPLPATGINTDMVLVLALLVVGLGLALIRGGRQTSKAAI
jgi:hypothetical protein